MFEGLFNQLTDVPSLFPKYLKKVVITHLLRVFTWYMINIDWLEKMLKGTDQPSVGSCAKSAGGHVNDIEVTDCLRDIDNLGGICSDRPASPLPGSIASVVASTQAFAPLCC